MDLSKVVWVIVIVAVGGGIWLFTDGGMNKVYEEATKNLVGNDPERDIFDEAALSKYGDRLMLTFRYEKARKFYAAGIERYGMNGKNYWWNLQQIAKCEEKLGNEEGAVEILYGLWVEDGDAYDERVSSRKQLQSRIQKLVELNGINELLYSFDDRYKK